MYRCRSFAKFLTWHKNGVNSNGLIRSVPNFVAWKDINGKWPKFAVDPHNVRLK